ncbi:hypothetical protein [Variovorax sp.]|uniref:hypothetical protein n=1 Tax=Variovorax sp. TaxID=1871043 RepID=UPI002D3A0EA9|nr:hypothetical protein [Variovorax sp.]HYP82676.1 hypothetical protein [Variovorax sp.]
MNPAALIRAVVASILLVGLAGCGGGGGGGGSQPAGPPVELSGRVTFDSVPPAPGGALDYAAATAKPVRGALVEVLALGATAPIGSTTTDEAGRYALNVPGGAQVGIRVRAQLVRDDPGGRWNVTVRDNTQGDAIYAMESPFFSTENGPVSRDLHAASGWGGGGYAGPRTAAPFAVLDTIYQAMAKIEAVAPGTSFPALRVFWSVENVPAAGRIALGQIGTSSYTRDGSGDAIYLLGKENVDTDEYDASVIAHEWGHYFQSAFSRDDSPGGPHGPEDRLDPRVAFSEGWGNAWSGMALDRSHYTDSVGPAQSLAADLDLAAGGQNPGWFNESSVQAILWRLYVENGLGPIQRAFTGPLRQTPALVSIHAFAAAYAAVLPSGQAALAAALGGQAISPATNDPWATGETNGAGVPGVLPIYVPAAVGAAQTACVRTAAGSFNKLGNTAFLRYAVPQARSYRFAVSGPAGTDPDLAVFTTAGKVAAAVATGTSDSLDVELGQGEIVVALYDANEAAPTSCFQVTLN